MHDQVRDALEAMNIAEGQSFPLIGPPARGLPLLGPLYYYLLALPFWFSRDPFGAVLFISLLNLLTVYLTYRLGKRFVDRRVGLIAAGLYATFPMAVIDSKALWNPGLIPVFTTCFMYAFFHFLVGGSPWGMVGALVALACALQIHLSTVGLGLLAVVGVVLYRPPVSLKHLTLGLVLFLGICTPVLVHEVMQEFPAVRHFWVTLQVSRQVFAQAPTIWLVWEALTSPFLIPIGMLPPSAHPLQGFFAIIQYVELMLFFGGLGYLLWRMVGGQYQQKGGRSQAMVLLWVLLPVLVIASILRGGLAWYYFNCLYPAQFLVIAIALTGFSLPQHWAVRFPAIAVGSMRYLGYTAAAVVALSQVLYLGSLHTSTVSTGEMRFPPRMFLGLGDELIAHLKANVTVTVPMRYKRALTERLLGEFQVDQDGFAQRIHGPVFEDLREDKGFFRQLLASPATNYGRMASARHYLIVQKEQFPEILTREATEEVGPFRIVPYQPLIRYWSWVYATNNQQGWFGTQFDDLLWKPIGIPARGRRELFTYELPQLYAWEGPSLYIRGWLEPTPVGKRPYLIVGLKDSIGISPFEVRLYVNGARVEVSRTLVYRTLLGKNDALVFDVSERVTQDPARVALHVAGRSSSFDLDIYELVADETPPWR